jgi:hypothetical protein
MAPMPGGVARATIVSSQPDSFQLIDKISKKLPVGRQVKSKN